MDRPAPVFDWFVPIDGDGAHLGTERAERPPTFEYLRAVATTAEAAGYRSLLVPTRFANGLFDAGAPLAETWTTATALAAVTDRIRYLVAVRPGFVAPGLLAQMAATFAQLSGGRLDLNVVPGGIQGDAERLGVTTDHATRYEQAEELIDALRLLWSAGGAPVDYEGAHVRLAGALVSPPPPHPGPAVYLGGASDAALALAGRRADVLLAWIQPLDATATLLDRARTHFAAAGRPPRFGLRSHVVLGATEADAWTAADELLVQASDSVREQRRAQVAGSAMVGARAQAAAVADHRLGPHLWNGISTVRVNCGTALVGTPDQVAAELCAYHDLGFDEFILSGFPHDDAARAVAESVLPAVRRRVGAG